MNKALSTFTFPVNSAQIRTITDENGDVWFVASDVAAALGYANVPNAIVAHCKRAKSLKDMTSLNQGGQEIQSLSPNGLLKLIPEADIYRLPSSEW